MMWYLVFKWIHVLSAIAALGSNFTFAIWLVCASRTPHALVYTLQTIKLIDERLTNRAYGLLLITGLIMVFVGSWALTTTWLIAALVLYVTVGALAFLGFTPALRKQIRLAETSGPQSAEYQAAARQVTIFGTIAVALVVTIVFLMITKPQLWS